MRYKALKNRNTKRKNTGAKYNGTLLLKTTSNLLWDNAVLIEIGSYIENFINNLIYMVKGIKKSVDYIEPKDSDDIN